jgi:hypothetical protein
MQKNVKLMGYNKIATLAQCTSGAVFLLLLMLVQKIVENNGEVGVLYTDIRDPPLVKVGSLPRCYAAKERSCYTFVFTPSTNAAAVDLADDICQQSNGSCTGPDKRFGYKGFANRAVLEDWLVDHPNTTSVAVHFADNMKQYELQVNTSRVCRRLGQLFCSEPRRELVIPAQVAINQALL